MTLSRLLRTTSLQSPREDQPLAQTQSGPAPSPTSSLRSVERVSHR